MTIKASAEQNPAYRPTSNLYFLITAAHIT
jgi:hypothetical protein